LTDPVAAKAVDQGRDRKNQLVAASFSLQAEVYRLIRRAMLRFGDKLVKVP
jgi:hypothetical protein